MRAELAVYAFYAVAALVACGLVLLVVSVVLATVAGWWALVRGWVAHVVGSGPKTEVVRRVVDGDTVWLYGHNEKPVRIADIDAPDEGKRKARATRVLRRFLPKGTRVRVEWSGKPDKYGRPLALLWRGNRSVSTHMIHRLAAVRWDGKGRSPLKRWTLARLLVGR